MSKSEALHELYSRCMDINFDESFELLSGAKDQDEANFFRFVTDYVLKQKQKKVIMENRF